MDKLIQGSDEWFKIRLGKVTASRISDVVAQTKSGYGASRARYMGELIAETVLSIEMGADAHDIGLSIHPHPTLSESVAMAAEIKEGTITDLYIKKR